jgi:hypothetical protein
VLARTGTVLDRIILTSLESVWDVHAKAHTPQGERPAPLEEEEKEITALLVQYGSPLAVLQLPFPLIVLAAGLLGLVGGRLAPERFVAGTAAKHGAAAAGPGCGAGGRRRAGLGSPGPLADVAGDVPDGHRVDPSFRRPA